jgi:hypothetical protein
LLNVVFELQDRRFEPNQPVVQRSVGLHRSVPGGSGFDGSGRFSWRRFSF